MKVTVLLLTIICPSFGLEWSENSYSIDPPPAVKREYVLNLQEKFSKELRCLKRLDTILASKWKNDLDKIPTKDLGVLMSEFEPQSPSKSMYNTHEQEWLLESGSASREIEKCVRGLVPEIVPLMNQNDINCLNNLFGYHIEEELVHEEYFAELLRKNNQEQLPFKRFISFTEYVELMYQNRNPDALTELERVVYEHAESYLDTENDRIEKTYIIEQECEWKNARALREAANSEVQDKEFTRQVLDSVYKQLAEIIVKKWHLNSTLPQDKYIGWLNSRDKMIPAIRDAASKLRREKRDAQYLCEYATKLAYKLSDEQSKYLILDENYNSVLDLDISKVAEESRTIEKALERADDFRLAALKILADKHKKGKLCLGALLHLVQNHRRFDIALGFVNGQYTYPEFFCKQKNQNLGLIATRFCKCVGSFCVAHGLAALFAEEYALLKGPDGRYMVARSGVKSRKKVQAWNNQD